MSRPTIFITGATGFIGSQVVFQSLNAGYNLRLSVRKEAQIDKLKGLFSEHVAKLDFIVIPDLASPGVFDQALKGVEYVFHMASPMPGTGDDFKTTYVAPAVQGTTTLLDAAEKIATIKRVVIVSSVVSLVPMYNYMEGTFHAKEGVNPTLTKDFNLDLEFPDPMTSGGLKYHGSKLLAHRATLDWVETHKPHFAVITLHPSFVVGRSLIQTSPDTIDAMNGWMRSSLLSEKPFMPSCMVDVEDVAAAHLKALEFDVGDKSEVQEFLLTGAGWRWDRVVDFVNEKYPTFGIKMTGPFEEIWKIETKRAVDLLGMRWRSVEDTVTSMFDQQLQFGA